MLHEAVYHRLAGKVAIVTGAGSGLGEATTKALARAGVAVAAADMRADAVQRVVDAIVSADGKAISLTVDVADPAQVQRCVDATVRAFGRLDVVVNNAGVDYTRPFYELSVEEWDRVLDVNLRAAFLFARAAFPIMREQGGGHFVNVASTAALRGWANCAAYHASKWGLLGFTRGLGVDGRPFNIRATALIPGGMATHFFDRLEVKPDPKMLNDPANVAEVIVFVLSQPPESVIQEVLVTPATETSWP